MVINGGTPKNNRECGVMVAHAPWEGGERFESYIFDQIYHKSAIVVAELVDVLKLKVKSTIYMGRCPRGLRRLS